MVSDNSFRSFVPVLVEYFYESRKESSGDLSTAAATELTEAAVSSMVGALLFVDMSGFTPLSEELSKQGSRGIELLSQHLNDYFGSMVSIIHAHHGDILKFAGDALMILFTTAADPADCSAEELRDALRHHTHQAAVCALALHSAFDFYSPTPGITLRLHSAISAGQFFGLHMGGWKGRWEWLLKGKPIHGIAVAMKASEKGEVVVHRSAYRWVSKLITATPLREREEQQQQQQQQKKEYEDKKLVHNMSPPVSTLIPSLSSTDTAVSSVKESQPERPSPSTTASSSSSSASSGRLTSQCYLLVNASPPVRAEPSARKYQQLKILVKSASLMASTVGRFSGRSPSPLPLTSPLPTATHTHLTTMPSTPSNSILPYLDMFTRRALLFGQDASSPSSRSSEQSTVSAQKRLLLNTAGDEDGSAAEVAFEERLGGYVPSAVVSRVSAGHRTWLAEFRRVTTLFILLPELQIESTPNHDDNDSDREEDSEQQEEKLKTFPPNGAVIAEFQSMARMMMEVCAKHRGDVRQLITDDKGTVMILLFGLQADWANPLRGVRAAVEIHQQMKERQLGHVAIGITTGQVFCGTVGNAQRCEYTAVGDKVNTAARLMCAVPGGDGIYMDADTMNAHGTSHSSAIGFHSLPPISLKGKAAPFAIFRVYNVKKKIGQEREQAVQALRKQTQVMIGRVAEMKAVDAFLHRLVDAADVAAVSSNRLYLESICHGQGMSLFLSSIYSRCHSLHYAIFTGHADELDQSPYFVFQTIIPHLLKLLSEHKRQSLLQEKADVSENADNEEQSWLHDPSCLSLPSDYERDPSPLVVLNQCCQAVTFQHNNTTSIDPAEPSALSPSAISERNNSKSSSTSLQPPEPPRGEGPASSSSSSVIQSSESVLASIRRQLSTSQVVVKQPPSITEVLTALFTHLHFISSPSSSSPSSPPATSRGHAIIVDHVEHLDSSSEDLLVTLSKSLPWLLFIFVARSSSDVSGQENSSCSLKKRLVLHRTTPADASVLASLGVTGTSVSASSNSAVLHAGHITLSGFNSDEMNEFLQATLHCVHVDSDVVKFVLERSNGIPVFAQEMALSFVQSNIITITQHSSTAAAAALVDTATGMIRQHSVISQFSQHSVVQSQSQQQTLPSVSSNSSGTKEADSVSVCTFTPNWSHSVSLSSLPSSMDEMLASRFDTLSPDQQQLLRIAAVFGRSVEMRCVRRLWTLGMVRRTSTGTSTTSTSSSTAEPKSTSGVSKHMSSNANTSDERMMELEKVCESLVDAGYLVPVSAAAAAAGEDDQVEEKLHMNETYSFKLASLSEVIYNRMPFA